MGPAPYGLQGRINLESSTPLTTPTVTQVNITG